MLLGATQVGLILAITVITIPLPAIQRDFGLGEASLALVSQAYGLAFGGLLLLGGRLTDVLGHRRAFRVGVMMFGVASAAAALAPDLGVLLAARFAQGGGAALTAPAAMALLRSVFPGPARQTRAVAVWGSLAVTGANTGTLLSGFAVTWASWRWGFAVPVTVAAVAAAAAPRLLPAGPPPVRRPLDVPGAMLATAGLAGISYGLAMSSGHPWASANVAWPLLGGALAIVAFAAIEARAPAPLLPLSFVASVRRGSALLAVLLGAAASAGTSFVLSLYFQQVRGYSALETTAAFLPFVLVILSGQVAGRLMGRLGSRAVTTMGLGLTAAGLLLLGGMGPRTPYFGTLLAGLVVFPLGLGLALSGAVVAAVDGTPASQSALAGGVVNTVMETGPAAGVAGMVAIAGARAAPSAGGASRAAAMASGYSLALTVSGIAFIVAAAVAVVVLRQRAAGHAPKPADRIRSSGTQFTRTRRRGTMTHRFAGQVTLVTGGGHGIGRGIARAFAREGATVVVAGRGEEALTETVKLIEAGGGRAGTVTADVTRTDDVARLISTTVAKHGGLDIAVNNAGVFAGGPAADLDETTWESQLAVNLTGVWLSMKHEIGQMLRGDGGVIVNIASTIGAHVTYPGTAAYAASKAGVSALTRAAAQDYISRSIRINAVSPGPADTPMSLQPGETEDDRAERLKSTLPIGRTGTIDEISAAVLWLASPEAGFAVGHDLIVDGGAAA